MELHQKTEYSLYKDKESSMKKTWSELMTWEIILYRECEETGEQKMYSYQGDCSYLDWDVPDEDLKYIGKGNTK